MKLQVPWVFFTFFKLQKWYQIAQSNTLIKWMLHKDFRAVTEWFYDNYIFLKPWKLQLLWENSNNDKFVFDNLCLENSNEEG